MEKHNIQQSDAQQSLQLGSMTDTSAVSQRENAEVTCKAWPISDAGSHWREVNKLTKALRKRGRGSRRRKDMATAQNNLWLPNAANGQNRNHREVGLQVCRHLVAALRLQHQQELSEREASNSSDAQRSA
jgi:hypothetical protein